MNDCVYIHEYIDIIGHNRENYMYHMAANWSPGAQRDRDEYCYGVWALLGTTLRWPMTVNMWERQGGWDGFARSVKTETDGVAGQDPRLKKWWSQAAEFRRGGRDRVLLPAPWTRTIGQLCDDGVKGVAYAHEMIKVRPGSAREFLERAREGAIAPLGKYGWELAGAFTTAMVDDDEALLIWSIPEWKNWSEGEAAHVADDDVLTWRSSVRDIVTKWQRILLTDSDLSPMKLGRQPAFSDRVDGWED